MSAATPGVDDRVGFQDVTATRGGSLRSFTPGYFPFTPPAWATSPRTVAILACALWPLTALAQEEGPRDVQLPNPMGVHTWFIILAIGAFLVWCISYVLELQKERMSSKPQRETLLRQKDELLDRLTQLESQKEAGTINVQRYEKEYRKARSRLSDVLSRLGRKQDSTET